MSGRIETAYRNYTRFYLNWSIDHQDVVNNRTLVRWEVGVQAQPGWTPYWGSNAIRLNSVYIDNQGSLASGTWSNITLPNGSSLPLRSGSVWVYHNSDGSKSFGASLSGWFYGNGDVSASGGWGLPTIPRNSQVTTDKASYTLGEPIRIFTNRKSGSFTHSITIRQNNSGGTVIKTFNSVADEVTWTPSPAEIITMQNMIPNSNTLTIHVSQWNNQVGQESSLTRSLSITDALPIFENFTFKDSNASVVAITGNDQVLIKGKSTLETTISEANKMIAVKGAVESRYSITFDGITSQNNYVSTGSVVETFSPINIGERTIVATAFDSRGNNRSVLKTVPVYDYTPPTIVPTLTRENNFGNDTTVHLQGLWNPVVIGGSAKNALTVGSLQYRYKEDGASSWTVGWTTRTFSSTENEWSMDTDFVVSLDNTKKYIFEFKISDKFETVTVEASVDVGKPILFVGENNGQPAVSIGSMPAGGAVLTINGVNFANFLYPVGSIYMSVNDTDPGTLFGGTWVAWGTGRVPVGIDTGQTEFNTTEKTGGHKSLQAHTHQVDPPYTESGGQSQDHTHFVSNKEVTYAAGLSPNYRAIASANSTSQDYWEDNWTGGTSQNHTHGVNIPEFTSGSTGAGNAQNLQPYITCYMWKRTA